MMLTGIYQYSLFLFSFEIQSTWGWSLTSLGLIYTIFHYTSTWVMPFSGMIADAYGPRMVALGASLLAAVLSLLGFLRVPPGRAPGRRWGFRRKLGQALHP